MNFQEDKKENVSSYWITLRNKKGFCKLKVETVDFIVRGIRFGKGSGPIVGDCGMTNDDNPNWAKAESLLRFLGNTNLDTNTPFSTLLDE